jgi:hypothetical protein
LTELAQPASLFHFAAFLGHPCQKVAIGKVQKSRIHAHLGIGRVKVSELLKTLCRVWLLLRTGNASKSE